MPNESLTVSQASVAALKQMSLTLQDLAAQMENEYVRLMNDFEQNQQGLGPHSGQIHTLLLQLKELSKPGSMALNRLVLKLETAATIRTAMLEDSPYGSGGGDSSPSAILGRIYDSEYHQRLSPREHTADGRHQGSWQGNTFITSDDFVPGKNNPHKLTFGQLRQQARQKYGIDYTGTPFVNGYADFSGISVAQVGLQDIVDANLADHPELYDSKNGVDFRNMFSDNHRSRNFGYADTIAAAKQLPIPGLKPGYTKDDLADWRKKNGFTWDESHDHGYLLVPGFIHNNTSHTGLVAIDTHGDDAEANFTARHNPQVTDPF